MNDRGGPAGWDGPSVVQITIESGPGGGARGRRANVLIAGLGTLPAIAAAAVIAVLPGGNDGSAAPRARVPAVPTPIHPIPAHPIPAPPIPGHPIPTPPIPGMPAPGAPSSGPATVLVTREPLPSNSPIRYPDTPLSGG